MRLTISILVSGKSPELKKCLDSVKELMGQIDAELILTDTGCDEETKELLKQYTTHIISFNWCDDFAAARNVGLKEASGEWFLFLDDDEWFDDVQPFVDFFTSREYKNYQQAAYYVRNYLDYSGKQYRQSLVSRMIRLEEQTHFEGKIHEALTPINGNCKLIDGFVHHYGYVNTDQSKVLQKHKRNFKILQEMKEAEPLNLKWSMYLIQEFCIVADGEKVVKEAKEALKKMGESADPFHQYLKGIFHGSELVGQYLQKKYDEVIYEAKIMGENHPEIVRLTRDIYAALSAKEIGDYETMFSYVSSYFQIYEQWKNKEYNEQMAVLEQGLFLISESVSEEKYRLMSLLSLLSTIYTGKEQEKIEIHKQTVKMQYLNLIERNADFLYLDKDMNEIIKHHMIDVEEELLQLDISQWMAQVKVIISSLEAFEKRKVVLDAVKTKKDIRYAYFEKEYQNCYLQQKEVSKSVEQVGNTLFLFALSQIEYAELVFKESALQEIDETLPQEVKGALYLSRALLNEDGEQISIIRNLRKAVAEYSVLASWIKIYIDKSVIREEKDG